MSREYITEEFCIGIAPLIPPEKISEILQRNSNLDLEDIISVLLEINDKYDSMSKTMPGPPGPPVPPNSTSFQPPLSGDEIFTKPCSDPTCSGRGCTYYHSAFEARRPQLIYQYGTNPCRHAHASGEWNPKRCRYGIKCKFAHSENEITYHRYNNRNNSRGPARRNREEEEEAKAEETKKLEDEEEKIEFVKFEKTISNDIGFLVNTVKMLKHEISDKNNQVDHKRDELSQLDNNLNDLREMNICRACRKNIFEYIMIPCGHTTCRNCKVNQYCPVCNSPVEIIIKEIL